MFSVGGALRELQNTVNALPGHQVTARVGWHDPKAFWTPERQANWAAQGRDKVLPVYQRQEIGGTEAQFGQGPGTKIASGYNALGAQTGDKPRAPRMAGAGLSRAAGRSLGGRVGWGVGGYK
jgi:hypothetical protein